MSSKIHSTNNYFESTNHNYFESSDQGVPFPDECKLQIFHFLEPAQLAGIRGVCREWKQLAEDNLLWRPVCQRAGIQRSDQETSFETFIQTKNAFQDGSILKKDPKHIIHADLPDLSMENATTFTATKFSPIVRNDYYKAFIALYPDAGKFTILEKRVKTCIADESNNYNNNDDTSDQFGITDKDRFIFSLENHEKLAKFLEEKQFTPAEIRNYLECMEAQSSVYTLLCNRKVLEFETGISQFFHQAMYSVQNSPWVRQELKIELDFFQTEDPVALTICGNIVATLVLDRNNLYKIQFFDLKNHLSCQYEVFPLVGYPDTSPELKWNGDSLFYDIGSGAQRHTGEFNFSKAESTTRKKPLSHFIMDNTKNPRKPSASTEKRATRSGPAIPPSRFKGRTLPNSKLW